MSTVTKQRCPDCGRTFKNLSNHNICHSRGSGNHADKPSVVQKQVCPDCGRDFVNLANHKICHGRGTRHRQTSDPPQSTSRSPAQPRTNVDYRQRNANPTPNQPHYPRYGTTDYVDTPPPTPSSPQRERVTPSSVPHYTRYGTTDYVDTPPTTPPMRVNVNYPRHDQSDYLDTPPPTPSSPQRERVTPSSVPHYPRYGTTDYVDTPPPTPPSPQRERQTPSSVPHYTRYGTTDYVDTPPTTPPMRVNLNDPRHDQSDYLDTPPPTPSSPERERLTPSPVTLLYPSIQTVPQGRGNTHHQPHPTQPQSRSHYLDGTSPPQPQLPSRQRSHQQRHHHDLESLLYGRISDASQRQHYRRGHDDYNSGLSDEDALSVAIAASRDQQEADLGWTFRDESDTNAAPTGSPRNIVREHRSRCMEFGACQISVNRDAVWRSSIAFFKDVAVSNTAKQLMVVFTDSEDRHEESVDTGGPRREYLRLLLQSIVSDSKMLHGDENQGFLIRPNIFAYSKNHFRVMGVMLATIIAQGGQSPTIFAPPVVDAILDIDQSLSVDYVPNRRTRESLTKMSEARDATELEEALQECDWRDDLDGIPSYVTMANRDEFLNGCVHHFVILQSKPMLDQLIQGLRHCGILDLIRRHTLRDLLEYRSDVEVTSERVMDLLKPVPSYHGDEQAIFNNLHRFLQAAEEGRLCDVLGEGRCLTRNQTEFARRMTPGRLLTFVTGCSREPAGGFTPRPSIVFNYSDTWRLPSASTCSNQIQLTVHTNLLEFQSFCHTMMTSMMNGETFSTA